MAINDKNQLRDIPIGISKDSLYSSFLLLPLELFTPNKSKYIYKIRTLCLLFHYLSLFVTICHSVLHVLHFIFTIYTLWTKIFCVKNLIYHHLIYNILCSNNYLMISILSALFDFAYCLLLITLEPTYYVCY